MRNFFFGITIGFLAADTLAYAAVEVHPAAVAPTGCRRRRSCHALAL